MKRVMVKWWCTYSVWRGGGWYGDDGRESSWVLMGVAIDEVECTGEITVGAGYRLTTKDI